MKRHIVVAVTLALSLLTVTAYADEGRHAERLQRLAGKLQLDDSQIEQFTTIMKDHHQTRKANREATREARQEMREALMVKLADVLTEQQLNDFREMAKKRHKERMEKHSRRGNCDPVASTNLAT